MHINQTIYATPARGYKFVWWNDGDTSNPRTVFVTQDTTFIAYFSDRDYYHVTAKPDYPVRGHVDGSGTYFEGDTVTLTAIPNNTVGTTATPPIPDNSSSRKTPLSPPTSTGIPKASPPPTTKTPSSPSPPTPHTTPLP